MPWKPLSARLGIKPLVLAGPMLRKVTPTSVTVWLALKQTAKVTLSVLSTDAAVASPLFFSSASPTVAIGPNLHIVAVTARAGNRAPLQPGVLYFYDLAFDVAGQSLTLAGAVGSADTSTYAYGALRLPSFLVPSADINLVRLAQGSCRKPHADGPDALAILDQRLAQSFNTPKDRPQQLILGGDQIYADEVADVLLLMLSDAAKLLVGQEQMATRNGAFVVAEALLPTTRTQLIEQAGFTSEDTRSHLMSLGEYLTMYLFAWSDVLWPELADIPGLPDLVAAGVPLAPEAQDVKTLDDITHFVELLDSIATQAKRLIEFAKTLKLVRRALANIPTYMILDDHEVTDDFNMTREFCEKVYGDPLGTRIVRNGLAAYALCQHWGNAPEQFEPTTLMGAPPAGVGFLESFAIASTKPTEFDATLKNVLGLHTPAQMAAQTPFAVYHDVGTRVRSNEGEWLDSASLLFHYTIETLAYQLIVTDTRTWRSFPRRGGNRAAPDLIASSQLATQIGGTADVGTRMLLVLFTTNFPPCPAIRQGGRDLPQFGKKYVYKDFFDSWDVERVDFGRTLAELSRKFQPLKGVLAGSLVVLSGDVHSSSVSRIHYKAETAQTGDPPGALTKADLVVVQLITSALHNQSEETLGQHVTGYAYVPPKFLAKVAKQRVLLSEDFIGWNPRTTPAGTTVAKHSVQIILVEPLVFDKKFNADEDKSIITHRVEDLSVVWTSRLFEVVKPPDFRIHLEYRKMDASAHSAHTPPLIDKTDPMRRAKDSAFAIERYASRVRKGSFMVGMNNIAEIQFTVDPKLTPSKQVHFTVRWLDENANQQVRFDVPLDATNDFAKYPGEP